ncbi:MAG: helix-turn-helix domain-containing protein [Ilumatobacteraceae bacterium]
MELSMMTASELASELGARVRSERVRQNLTQQALAERAGVSRLTVLRMEEDGSTTLTKFLAVLTALRRAGDLDGLLEPPQPTTIDEFVGTARPIRRRVRS